MCIKSGNILKNIITFILIIYFSNSSFADEIADYYGASISAVYEGESLKDWNGPEKKFFEDTGSVIHKIVQLKISEFYSRTVYYADMGFEIKGFVSHVEPFINQKFTKLFELSEGKHCSIIDIKQKKWVELTAQVHNGLTGYNAIIYSYLVPLKMPEEQIKSLVMKADPEIVTGTARDFGDWKTHLLSAAMHKIKIIKGRKEQPVIIYRAQGTCHFCIYQGLIILDEKMNILSKVKVTTGSKIDLTFVDLNCNGIYSPLFHIVEGYCCSSWGERIVLYNIDKKGRFNKFAENVIGMDSGYASERSYTEPKEIFTGGYFFGKCEWGGYRPLIITKEYRLVKREMEDLLPIRKVVEKWVFKSGQYIRSDLDNTEVVKGVKKDLTLQSERDEQNKIKNFIENYWRLISERKFNKVRESLSDSAFYYSAKFNAEDIVRDKKKIMSKCNEIKFYMWNYNINIMKDRIVVFYDKYFDIDNGKKRGRVRSCLELLEVDGSYKVITEKDI